MMAQVSHSSTKSGVDELSKDCYHVVVWLNKIETPGTSGWGVFFSH
jgi:hypothetical protein